MFYTLLCLSIVQNADESFSCKFVISLLFGLKVSPDVWVIKYSFLYHSFISASCSGSEKE